MCKICQKFNSSHCVKSFRIRSFSDPYIPAFGLDMKRYGVSLRTQFECRKIWIRKTQNTETFNAVINITVLNNFSARLVIRLLTFALTYLEL